MANGILAGISIQRENEIQPKFDAGVYKFIMGQDGHAIDFMFSHAGDVLNITANGFAIADGVRAFFNNVLITGKASGYVYVEFSVHHDPTLTDVASIRWSDNQLTEQHDRIGTQAGTYIMKVLEVTPSDTDFASGKIVNSIQYPNKAVHAENATVVTERLESGVTAVTQPISDKSRAVATTEFVQNVLANEVNAGTATSTIKSSNIDGDYDAGTVNFYRRAKYVIGTINHTRGMGVLGSSSYFDIPAGFRPKNEVRFVIQTKQSSGALSSMIIAARGDKATTERIYNLTGVSASPIPLSNASCFGYETE